MGDQLRSILAKAHAEIASGRPTAALQSVVEAVSAAGLRPDHFPSLLRAHQLSAAAQPHMDTLSSSMAAVSFTHAPPLGTQPLPVEQQHETEDMMQVWCTETVA